MWESFCPAAEKHISVEHKMKLCVSVEADFSFGSCFTNCDATKKNRFCFKAASRMLHVKLVILKVY